MANTHFGFTSVDETEKAGRVRGVFDSVASRYDLMNDVLSMGLHRAWKAYAVAVAAVQPGWQVLDIAGGTGDLASAFAKQAGAQGCVHGHQDSVQVYLQAAPWQPCYQVTVGQCPDHEEIRVPQL